MTQTLNKAKLQGLILKYLQMPCFYTAASWRNYIVEKADDLMNHIYMGIKDTPFTYRMFILFKKNELLSFD